MNENVLYLEADEDITSAIDKLQRQNGGAVRIVVPKRSTMLQSVINLKLLKKAAADTGKDLVLVTNDRIATDLAARVGLAVATSLGAKASQVEAAPAAPTTTEEIIEEADPEPPHAPEPPVVPDKPKPVKRPLFARKAVADKPEPPTELAAGAGLGTAAAAVKPVEPDDTPADTPAAKPRSGPKIPDFGQLQRRLLWLGAGAFLIVGYLVAMYFLTTAKVTLYASGTKVDIDTTFSADPALKSSDLPNGVLAAQPVSYSKDLTATFTPTGEKDAGTKASGTITVVNNNAKAYDFVAGTRFMAADGKIFRANADVHIDPASATVVGFPPQAVIVPKKVDVAVTADQNGDSYNEAPGRYTLPGLAASEQQYVYGEGKQMSGGTSKIMKVVTQADVDKAKADLLAKQKDSLQKDLQDKVPTGYLALAESAEQTTDNLTSQPGVNEEASGNATLTLKLTSKQLAVPRSEFEKLIQDKEQDQIGAQNQVYDNGLDSAKITLGDRDATGRISFHLATQAYGGAKLDKTGIAKQLAGKRYGDAANLAAGLPGIQRSEISLKPAWSTSLPHRLSNITVTIQVAGQDQAKSK